MNDECERVLAEHEGLIEQVARKLVGAQAWLLEDLMQEGRVAVVRAHAKFDAGLGVPFRGLAAFYARNQMVDWLRRFAWPVRLSQSALKRGVKIQMVDESHVRGLATEGAAAEDERLEALRAAVAGLPPRLREVVDLQLREELDRAGVAARLGLSLAGVKSRQNRALKHLRRVMGALDGGQECPRSLR